ncbi:hypothetical protein OSB04_023205 [Centaurea solstitialis]|uniref:HAT C-terminal dimerisation domain-containing protein n=1 Tax=Centaurea solstitialis TaxID=347529 RepID=A0AA38SR82_9ASTR|nr:hypothetical protein OSB04_023205 [Centaurea solstitialis]
MNQQWKAVLKQGETSPVLTRSRFAGARSSLAARFTVSSAKNDTWNLPKLDQLNVGIVLEMKRVCLGLTCSASKCERNWSMINQVHTKRRNCLNTKRMNSLVYIMNNMINQGFIAP